MTTTLQPTQDEMIAVVKQGPGPEAVVLASVPIPSTPPGYAKVRVLATGICGTDVHVAHDEYAHEAPVVMGHEITGVVENVGSASDDDWVSARVSCETYFSVCGRCMVCRDGRPNLCRFRRSLGSFENGGFAAFVVMPLHNLHRIPDWLGEHDGALAEPLACITQCLMNPSVISAGDRVLVTGPGAMGQLAAQVALAHGADVTLAGLPQDADRLAVAAALGIGTTTGKLELDSFDVVIECSGSAAGARVALIAARRGARYVQIGIFGKDVTLPFDQVLYKELVVSSGFASTPASWDSAIRLIEEKRVNLAPLITRRVPITDFFEALQAAEKGEGLKTVVIPG